MSSESPSLSDRFFKSSSLMLEKIPGILLKYKKTSWFLTILSVVCLTAGMQHFKINQSMDAFFDDHDPTLMRYNWFKYIYGSDEFVLIMYQPKEGDVFSPESLERVRHIEQTLNEKRILEGSPLKRIRRVRSLISADYLEGREDALLSRPFIGDSIPSSQAEQEALRQLALEHPDFPGTWFSKDSRFGVIMVETDFGARPKSKPESSEAADAQSPEDEFDFAGEERSELLKPSEIPELESPGMEDYPPFYNALKEVFAQKFWSENNQMYLAGNPVIMSFFSDVILKQIGFFSMLSVVMIWIVMFAAFRSFSTLVWPTLTLVVAVTTLMGLIGWSGIEMTFMINIITFLLLAVSVAISIHIISGYNWYRNTGSEPPEALSKTYYKTGVPVLLAGITTAIGLVSLIFVPVPAISNFGLFASIGVVLTMLSNLVLWPLLISVWAPSVKKQKDPSETRLGRILAGQKDRALNHKKLTIGIFVAIALVFASGLPRVFIDTNFLKMIKPGYEITESYDVIDQHFGGTAAFEILVDTGKQDGVKNAALLKTIDSFSKQALEKYEGKIVRSRSVVNVTKESYKNMTDLSQDNYRIPDTDAEVSQVLVSFESADPVSRRMIVDDNWQVARITFSIITDGTQVYQTMLDDLMAMADKAFKSFTDSSDAYQLSYSGGVGLMVRLINYISTAQLKSFSLALLVITLVLFFVFGSLKLGLLAMIPNIFPLIVAGGSAGWLGFPLDSDTLLVMPIAIGIAVDDTIHFLTHYKSELIDGKDSDYGIHSSLTKVGQAMVFTTVVLSLGFMVFVLSVYNPLANFGILSALAITSALLADLFLLPVLLDLFKPVKSANFTGKKLAAIAIGALMLPVAFSGADAATSSLTAEQIAQKMIDRDDGKSSWSKVVLLSCNFGLKGEKRSCQSGKRKKTFEMVSVDLDTTGKNKRSASFIIEPATDKGVGFLQEDFEDDSKDSEQWIYMPALKKKKKIVAAAGSGPKTGTLFGSELAYEDMEQVHIKDYTWKILREEKEQDRDTWVLETRPTDRRKAKTSYEKGLLWVDKETYLVVKSESYDRHGALAKTFYSRKQEKLDGVWVSRQQIVVNHINKRMSMMKSVGIHINPVISTEAMSPRILDDAGFRETLLQKVRK